MTKYCRRNHKLLCSCFNARACVGHFCLLYFCWPFTTINQCWASPCPNIYLWVIFSKKGSCVWVTKYVTLTKNKGTFTELIRIQDKYLYTFSSFVCYMCIKDDRNILSVGRSDFMSVYKYFETKFFCC